MVNKSGGNGGKHETALRRFNVRLAADTVTRIMLVGGAGEVLRAAYQQKTMTLAVIWLMCLNPSQRAEILTAILATIQSPEKTEWVNIPYPQGPAAIEYVDFCASLERQIETLGEQYFLTTSLPLQP